jgi:hypothetical protein
MLNPTKKAKPKKEHKHCLQDHILIKSMRKEVVRCMNNVKHTIKGYNLEKSLKLAKEWLLSQGVREELHGEILTPFNIKRIQIKKPPVPRKRPAWKGPRRKKTWEDVLKDKYVSKSVYTVSGGIPGTGKNN